MAEVMRGKGYRIRGKFDAAAAERLLDAGVLREWRPGYYADQFRDARGAAGDLKTDEISAMMVDLMVPFLRDLGVTDVYVERKPGEEWSRVDSRPQ